MGMDVILQEEQKCPGAHNGGTAMSGPRTTGEKLRTLGFFLIDPFF